MLIFKLESFLIHQVQSPLHRQLVFHLLVGNLSLADHPLLLLFRVGPPPVLSRLRSQVLAAAFLFLERNLGILSSVVSLAFWKEPKVRKVFF